jgi:hypothetical protein
MGLLKRLTTLVRVILKRLIDSNKELILQEGRFMRGFYVLVFKQINTGQKWTKEELRELRRHLWHLSGYIPVLVLFLLPGGSLLLPLLAELLDRRKDRDNNPISYGDASVGPCCKVIVVGDYYHSVPLLIEPP